MAYFVRCYNDERRRSSAGAANGRLDLQAQLVTVDRQIARAVAAVIEDRITREKADLHLPALRARRAELGAGLAALAEPPKVISLQPGAIDGYLRNLDRLEEMVNQDLAEGTTGRPERSGAWFGRSSSCQPRPESRRASSFAANSVH